MFKTNSLIQLFHSIGLFVIIGQANCREYGYSFIGTRAQVVTPHQNWGPRISAIPVISSLNNGVLDDGLYRGHVNEGTFLDFVRDVLAPVLLPFNGVNPRSVVIMGTSNEYG